MIEILKYVLGSFWRFVGFAIILYITLFFITNGITQAIGALKSKTPKKIDIE